MTATYQLELTVDEISKLHEGISRHLWRLQKIYPKPSNVRRLIERYQERAEELAMILLEADATGLTEDIEPGPENGPGREPEPSPFGMPPGIEGTAEELAGWIGAHHMEQSQVPLPLVPAPARRQRRTAQEMAAANAEALAAEPRPMEPAGRRVWPPIYIKPEPKPEPEPEPDRAGPLTTEELPAPEVVKLTAYSRSN